MNRHVIGFIIQLIAIILYCSPVQAAPNSMWGEASITVAYAFLKAVADKDIDKAHSMLDETFTVSQGTRNSFKNITHKKIFTAHFNRIFNDDFIKVLKSDLKKELHSFGPDGYGRSQWYVKLNQENGSQGYSVVFNESARPIMFSNPTIIAPSFNCLLARSKTEKILCSNLALSKLDVAVSKSYTAAKKYLTGIEYNSLKDKQRQFNKSRNKCSSDINCLTIALTGRNKKIKNLIDKEYKKNAVSFDGNDEVAGAWANEKWINAANCESSGDVKIKENTLLNITYKYPYIIMSKKDKFENSTLVCKVKSILTSTYKKIEDDNVDDFDWGSCRGDINKLNYRGNYTYMPLEKINAVGKTDECENAMIIISGHKGSYQMIYNAYSDYSAKNGLAGSGFLMKKIELGN